MVVDAAMSHPVPQLEAEARTSQATCGLAQSQPPLGISLGWREPLRLYTPPTGASTFSNWWIQAGRAVPLASIQDITEGPSAPELPTILRPFLSFSPAVQPLWPCTPWWSCSQNIPHADLCLRVCVLGNLI